MDHLPPNIVLMHPLLPSRGGAISRWPVARAKCDPGHPERNPRRRGGGKGGEGGGGGGKGGETSRRRMDHLPPPNPFRQPHPPSIWTAQAPGGTSDEGGCGGGGGGGRRGGGGETRRMRMDTFLLLILFCQPPSSFQGGRDPAHPKRRQYLDVEDEHEKSFRRDKVGTARGRKAIDNDEFHNLSSGLGSAKMVEDIRRGLT
eukprot:315767-Pyramimonas_sp.AAC.1